MKASKKLIDINRQAYGIGRGLKLLGHLSWPAHFESEFLKALEKKKATLPEISYEKIDYSEQKDQLTKLCKSFTPSSPLEMFTWTTIKSYIDLIDLNHTIGTPEFCELSKVVFGLPGDRFPSSEVTNIEAAKQVVRLSKDFDFPYIKEPDVCIMADSIKQYLERRIRGVFGEIGPRVEVVDGLAAKATATAQRIKIRNGTHFTSYDFKQLFYHEVMTHSLTAINGGLQDQLFCMGCSSPRTLKTQEGLATFSEVITGSIDISRLKRLSLRILAIDMALGGADFRDVYQFFKTHGQSPQESYASTQRLFRGGYPDKNIIFTKDCIYLDGLMQVHTLFRWAMKHNRLELAHLLFSGRISAEDVFLLEEAYKSGTIVHTKYLPGWFAKIEGLAGSLVFSLLANIIRINVDGPSGLEKPA